MPPSIPLLKDSGDIQTSNENVELQTTLFGELRPTLKWGCNNSKLQLSLVQVAETSNRFDFKGKLLCDFQTGKSSQKLHVRKTFLTNLPSLQRLYLNSQQRISGQPITEPQLNPESLVPCGLSTLLFKDWAIGPGLMFNSSRSFGSGSKIPLQYTFTLNKNPQVLLLNPLVDIVSQARGLITYSPASALKICNGYTNNISNESTITVSNSNNNSNNDSNNNNHKSSGLLEAGVKLRLSVSLYNITSSQDARVIMGWDSAVKMHVSPNGGLNSPISVRQRPYIKFQEKRFGLKLSEGQWGCSFLL